MTYTEQGDRVTVEMSLKDWEQLIFMLGYLAGLSHKELDIERFYRTTDFVNRLNRTNPHFRPYDIPEKYRQPAGGN